MITLLVALVLFATIQDPSVPGSLPIPEKLALIVGVADYPEAIEAKLPDLMGPGNDAAQAREVLANRFGFPADAIKVLVNEEATHEAVVRAFREHLIDRAEPGTEVVFWYSGHGAQVPDASGFEASGFDSTFVLSDSRSATYDGEYDLTDDELSSLLDALAKKQANVLVVTDACHSGGATRGGRRGKAAPKGSRPLATQLVTAFWPKDVEFEDDDGEHHDRPGFVHIAACSATQEAQERSFEQPDGTFVLRGCLTHALCWFLNDAQPGDSFRTVADRTALWIAAQEPDQTPQFEGAVDRELFSRRFAARPRGFEAMLGSRRELTIAAGRLHGVRPRSEFTIEDAKGNRLGTARSLFVQPGETTAEWDGEPPADARSSALRANLIPGSGGRALLPLLVTDEALAARIAERFASRVSPVLANSPLAIDAYRLELSETPAGSTGVTYRLVAPDGIPLWRTTLEDVGDSAALLAPEAFDRFAAALEPALDHEAVHRELTSLPNESGSLKLRVALTPPDAQTLDYLRRSGVTNAVAAKFETVSGAAGVAATYRASFDPLGLDLPAAELTVENREPDPLYITVMSVSEDRNRGVIYPEEGVRDQMLPAGGSLTFPIALNGDSERRFARALRDRILVIATRRPVDFYGLAAKTTYRSGSAPSVLERAFRGSATRGGGDDDFGVSAIDIWVPGEK